MELDISKELSEAHWKWLESLLSKERQIQKKLYIEAFIHGYKHGKESTNGV